MSGAMHGGDEVGALVFDFGSFSIRGGFAGEDLPKLDIPSVVGVKDDINDPKTKKSIVGHNITVPSDGKDLNTFMKDCMIEDWDLFEKVVDYMLNFLTPNESTCHPILFSEPAWNTKAKREKLVEIMFEKFNVPAVYVAKNAVLSCFSNGRATGLVLDSGATYTSSVPVYDGHVLTQGIMRSPLAGDFVTRQTQRFFELHKVDSIPIYKVGNRDITKMGDRPRYALKKNVPQVGESFNRYMVKSLMQDFAASVYQVADDKYNESQADSLPMVSYEFPNGNSLDVGHERFQIPEALFDPSNLPESMGNSMLSMSHIVSSSISMCDMDVRSNLYNNVLIVGGNSLLFGFPERLQKDLNSRTPQSMRLKVNFVNTSAERRYSSWIGGSVMGSLGTFQQMWTSKQEYKEFGKSCIEKKCI